VAEQEQKVEQEVVSKKLTEVAKDLGISDDVARIVLSAISESDDAVEKLIGLVGTAGEALSKVPERSQQPLTQLLSMALYKQLSRDPVSERLTSLAGSLLTIKHLMRDENQQIVSQVLQKIDELNKQILEMRETKMREEFQTQLEQMLNIIDSLRQGLEELKKKIEETPKQQNIQQESASPLRKVVDQINETKELLNGFIESLKELGYEIKKPGEKEGVPDLTKLIKQLEELGFEVKQKSLTKEEVEKMIKSIEEKYKKRFKKKLEKIKALEEQRTKQLEIVGGIIMEVIRSLRGGGSSRIAEIALQRLQSQIIQQPSTQQSVQQQPQAGQNERSVQTTQQSGVESY
jgi:uncharacterized coiled-coil DUF342 family protein